MATPAPALLPEERWELLEHLHAFVDKPLTALAFIWLGLLTLEVVVGLDRILQAIAYAIWAIFVFEFGIAPHKRRCLRRHWLAAVALPALRVPAIASAGGSASLLNLVTSLNRGMQATPAGRVLGLGLAVYAFAIFGCITASVASWLAADCSAGGEPAPSGDTQAPREELAALRVQLAEVQAQLQARAQE